MSAAASPLSRAPRSNNYLVIGLNAALRPLSVKGDRPAHLKGPATRPNTWSSPRRSSRDTAQKLADYRKSKGLNAMVVTLEDIYESFNFGTAEPAGGPRFPGLCLCQVGRQRS